MSTIDIITGNNDKATQAVEFHRFRLNELQQRWDAALPVVSDHLLGRELRTSTELEDITARAWLERRAPDTPTLLGIAGPGASGKGTVGAYLRESLGFGRIINTTTRTQRHNEQDGIDYHFVDYPTFLQLSDQGRFATTTHRAGRGWYGIDEREVSTKLQTGSGVGCMIEESPVNLLQAFSAMTDRHSEPTQAALLYVLPPEPIMTTSARRLYGRSASTEAARRLTRDDVESTLGDRQIDEFLDLMQASNHPEVSIIVMVNDAWETTTQKLDCLFGQEASE